jgi:hypothetical protein
VTRARGGQLVLFASVTWLLYFYAPQPVNANGGDNLWYVPTAMSIVHRGSVDVSNFQLDLSRQDPSAVWITNMALDPRLTTVSPRRVNRFPIGPSLVAVPFVLLTERAFAATRSPVQRATRIARVAAASIATLSVLLMFALAFVLTGRWSTTWMVALFFAFASPHFSTHHSGFWSHNVSQPFVMLALLFLVANGGRMAWLGAFPLACAYATRPDASILIVGYSACILLFSAHTRVRYFLALMSGLGAFAAWSYVVYGTLRPPYYGLIAGTPIFSRDALLGTLISPNRGLFVFTPIYLLSVGSALFSWLSWQQFPTVYRFAAFVVAGQWLAISILNPTWWGGFSFGPRLFSPVLPLLTILAIPAFEHIRARIGSTGTILRGLVAVALVWSLFVQARGAFAAGPHEWNYRPNIDLHTSQLWNWSDLQIFR